MSKELKIGFIAILSIIVLFVGINYLKGLNVLKKNRDFYAKYESIDGLKVGSSVFVNGYQVGVVSNINFENIQLASLGQLSGTALSIDMFNNNISPNVSNKFERIFPQVLFASIQMQKRRKSLF